MPKLNYAEGTILRFRGNDGKKVHMGFVVNATKVMELIAKEGICRICLTDVNLPHPISNDKSFDRWILERRPSSGWSVKGQIERIAKAYQEFQGSQYNRINNNCQHFAFSAVCGYKSSPDVERFPSFMADLGILELFADVSDASSSFSGELISKYADDAKVFINQAKKLTSIAPPSSQPYSAILHSFSEAVDSIDFNEGQDDYEEEYEASTATNIVDIPNQIRQLGELLKENLITEQEFNEKKKELLRRL
jgi:hypothetical protein